MVEIVLNDQITIHLCVRGCEKEDILEKKTKTFKVIRIQIVTSWVGYINKVLAFCTNMCTPDNVLLKFCLTVTNEGVMPSLKTLTKEL